MKRSAPACSFSAIRSYSRPSESSASWNGDTTAAMSSPRCVRRAIRIISTASSGGTLACASGSPVVSNTLSSPAASRRASADWSERGSRPLPAMCTSGIRPDASASSGAIVTGS
jgi:hypothetical protein